MAVVALQVPAARTFKAVTPHDTTGVVGAGCLGIWVGGVGNLVVTDRDNTVVTFTAVPAGTLMPIAPKIVRAATTATLIVALY